MIRIHLYWREEWNTEHDLGHVYLDTIPPIGALISLPVLGKVVWRIDTIYVHPGREGSTALRNATGRAGGQVGIYSAFVIPAIGPHASGPDDDQSPEEAS